MSRKEEIEKEARRRYPYALEALIQFGIEMAEWADANPEKTCEDESGYKNPFLGGE